jgi:hypothetical protein
MAGDIEKNAFKSHMMRFMFLFGHCSLARGDEIRGSTLSDLFLHSMPYNMGPDREDMMCLLNTESKMNKTAEVHQLAAIRHADVMLCPITALGIWLLLRWPFRKAQPINFDTKAEWCGVHAVGFIHTDINMKKTHEIMPSA